MIRIGNGFDVHALREGLPFTLGGVRIDHPKGFVAHSDGDVLIHALCDALLGAAAQGDIGLHFPDTDPQYKGANSRTLLRHCAELVGAESYEVINVDCTIAAQAPKLRPHIDAMRANLATDLGLPIDRVSVKATTTERLGFVGREEGVAVWATVLIEK